uniref:Uncharacterized protein n=1 Tax=viral metagenome TaxID=1070528 RepID=A0A6C0M0X1_9ZZZZ
MSIEVDVRTTVPIHVDELPDRLYRIMHRDMVHFGHAYTIGLNTIDREPESPEDGIGFVDEKYLSYALSMFGNVDVMVCEVSVPEDAKVIRTECSYCPEYGAYGVEYTTNKLIIGKCMEICEYLRAIHNNFYMHRDIVRWVDVLGIKTYGTVKWLSTYRKNVVV